MMLMMWMIKLGDVDDDGDCDAQDVDDDANGVHDVDDGVMVVLICDDDDDDDGAVRWC